MLRFPDKASVCTHNVLLALKLPYNVHGTIKSNQTKLLTISRQHLLDPLSVAGLLDQVDICAEVELNPAPKHVYNNFHAPRPEGYRKGPTAFAGAIRLGLSRCLTAFVDGKKRENLRLGEITRNC